MKKPSLVILLSLLLAALPTGDSLSASGVAKVVITDLDHSQFPQITFYARATDVQGISIKGLVPSDFNIEEGNTPIQLFRAEEVDLGTHVSIVIDAGSGINSNGATFVSRLTEIKNVIANYVQGMGDNDYVEVLLLQPRDRVTVVQDFTNEKGLITQSVNALTLESPNSLSFGLEGLSRALDDLSGLSRQTGYKAVLYLSMGVQDQGRLYLGLSELNAKARSLSIPVHTILFRHSDKLEHYLDVIARETEGDYAYYTRAKVETPIFEKIYAQGSVYEFSYRSTNPAPSRVITLTVLPSVEGPVFDDIRLDLNPVPGAPEVTFVTINDNDPLIRQPDERAGEDVLWPTEVEVVFDIDWPDGYGNRGFHWAELVVDGDIIGGRIRDLRPSSQISVVWDLRTFTRSGETTHNVQIHFEDELGFEVLSPDHNVALTVRSGLCRQYQGASLITCYIGSIIAPALGVISFGLIVFAITYYYLRPEQFKARFGTIQASVQKFADEVTQTLRIRGRGTSSQIPMAYLHLNKGVTGMRKRYPLYQRVTQVGRDDPNLKVEDGDIAINDRAVSRPHVNIAIHGDEYTITDMGSANGTWLNGVELEAEEDQPLNEGDTIELAEYEPGERLVSFTFSLYGDDGNKDERFGTIDDADMTTPTRKKKAAN
jgi:hypothetical protein